MEFSFKKYQGTGNDFIMVDGRRHALNLSADQIARICDRKFGIGADGLIILKAQNDLDFEMDYYNADGSQSFCGNGSRCAQAFAQEIGLLNSAESTFLAIDGKHQGKKIGDWYGTHMADLNQVEQIGSDYFMDTGSPHYIRFVADVSKVDVLQEGRAIRNSAPYKQKGCNVNFVEIIKDGIKVRTYERGVENETLSCGTGVTAAAIAYVIKQSLSVNEVQVLTQGGSIQIKLNQTGPTNFSDIWLIGPAKKVFEGRHSFS